MAGYTRQSTFTDGDVITAAHSNDEFNQVLAAFVKHIRSQTRRYSSRRSSDWFDW